MIALILLATASFLFNSELRQEPVVIDLVGSWAAPASLLVAVVWNPEWALWSLRPMEKNRLFERTAVPAPVEAEGHAR